MIAQTRQRDQHDRDMRIAWTVAVLQRQKRVPELATLLTKRQQRQTARQQRTTLQLISEAYRIPLRTKTKKKANKANKAHTAMKGSRG